MGLETGVITGCNNTGTTYNIKGHKCSEETYNKLFVVRYKNPTGYTASDGDTLETIAKKFKIDLSELKRVNLFKNTEKIKAGDSFSLPIEIYTQYEEIYNNLDPIA